MHIAAKTVRGTTTVRVISVHEHRGQAIDACPVKGSADVFEVVGNGAVTVGQVLATAPKAPGSAVLVALPA